MSLDKKAESKMAAIEASSILPYSGVLISSPKLYARVS